MKEEPLHLDHKELLEEAGLRQIQERITTVTGLAILVTDPDGNAITRVSNLCPFCAMINNTDPGQARCKASRVEAAKAAAKSGHPKTRRCSRSLLKSGS